MRILLILIVAVIVFFLAQFLGYYYVLPVILVAGLVVTFIVAKNKSNPEFDQKKLITKGLLLSLLVIGFLVLLTFMMILGGLS